MLSGPDIELHIPYSAPFTAHITARSPNEYRTAIPPKIQLFNLQNGSEVAAELLDFWSGLSESNRHLNLAKVH